MNEEIDEQFRLQKLRQGLLGRGERLRELYLQSVEFHRAIDTLVQALPTIIDNLADEAELLSRHQSVMLKALQEMLPEEAWRKVLRGESLVGTEMTLDLSQMKVRCPNCKARWNADVLGVERCPICGAKIPAGDVRQT